MVIIVQGLQFLPTIMKHFVRSEAIFMSKRLLTAVRKAKKQDKYERNSLDSVHRAQVLRFAVAVRREAGRQPPEHDRRPRLLSRSHAAGEQFFIRG
jgi:hypothetical protein